MSSSSDTSLEEGEIPQEESNQGGEAISGSHTSHRGHSRQSSRGVQDDLEELQAGIHAYTRAVGLQDCLKDFPGVCDDLERALAKARAMFRLLHQKEPSVEGADGSADLAKAGVRLLNGLRSLHVFSTTGQGRDMAPAQEVVRTAWRDRELLFTASQRKQLEGWLRSSKRLAALLPRDAAGLFEPAQPSQPAQQPGAAAARHAAPVRRASEPALGAKQPPAAAASRSAAGAIAACPQPATASVGEKRSQASDEDSGSSTGGSSKRSKPGRPLPAAQQPPSKGTAAAVPPPPPPLPALANGAAATAPPPPPRETPLAANAAAAIVELIPPSPPPPHSPQQNSTGSRSMEVSHSTGAPSTAGSAVELKGYQLEDGHQPGVPAATAPSSQFHGVVVSEDVRGLLGRGKLCLVLDLDHTLLNSARYAEVDPELQRELERRIEQEALLPAEERLLFKVEEIKMWTKLRPGVHRFLQKAAKAYELWIHTNGNKSYAAAVVKLLDPTGKLFGPRVIAQGAERVEDMQVDQSKSFMQGLEGREAVTVVVDDSHSVWAAHRRNLVVVERYVFFPSSRKQLGLSRLSLWESSRDECLKIGMLKTTLDRLLEVHQRVLAAVAAPPTQLPSGEVVYANWDVRHVLGEMRQKVLRGLSVVFSRIIPLGARPDGHPLWQMAEAFGARCSTTLDATTTHVVATTVATDKVAQARQRGLFVVSPEWVDCSCILWERGDERRFPVLS